MVRNNRGQFARNQSKDIVAVLIIMFTMFGIAYYAKANTKENNWIDDRHNRLSVEGLSEDEEGIDSPDISTCIITGQGTGRIESYCADNAENLIKAIRTEWEEKEQVYTKTESLNKSIQAFITQYSRADSCHNVVNGKCLMVSGKPVYEGAVACPYSLKLGTKVEINGKIYTCEDRYAEWLDAKRGLPTFDIFVEQNPSGLYKADVKIID